MIVIGTQGSNWGGGLRGFSPSPFGRVIYNIRYQT